jgi:hypothetical protein
VGESGATPVLVMSFISAYAFFRRRAIGSGRDCLVLPEPRVFCFGFGAVPACASHDIFEPHPIGALGDIDLGVLAVADIAVKNTLATLPVHPRTTRPSDLGCRGYRHRGGS